MTGRAVEPRQRWCSYRGEPLSLLELAMVRLLVMLVTVTVLTAVTWSTAAPVALALVEYLVMDRVQVILDWVRREK